MNYYYAGKLWLPEDQDPAAHLVLPSAPTGYELQGGLYVPLAIVRGAFSQLLQPGFAALYNSQFNSYGYDFELKSIAEEDEMALVQPDTSKIPLWRLPPQRSEHPITAWRCWEIDESRYLRSVAADCRWEGPVLRAHKRPVDPKYWDAQEKKSEKYYEELHETFELSGVWTVKTREKAVEVAQLYHASCYGEVSLWGRIAQFTLGYRAEVCMIKRLFLRVQPEDYVRLRLLTRVDVMTNNKHQIKELRQLRLKQLCDELSARYGCEVTVDTVESPPTHLWRGNY